MIRWASRYGGLFFVNLPGRRRLGVKGLLRHLLDRTAARGLTGLDNFKDSQSVKWARVYVKFVVGEKWS